MSTHPRPSSAPLPLKLSLNHPSVCASVSTSLRVAILVRVTEASSSLHLCRLDYYPLNSECPCLLSSPLRSKTLWNKKKLCVWVWFTDSSRARVCVSWRSVDVEVVRRRSRASGLLRARTWGVQAMCVWSPADSNRIRPASASATGYIELSALYYLREFRMRNSRIWSSYLCDQYFQNHKGLKMRLQKRVMVLLALMWMWNSALCAKKSSARKSGECHFHFFKFSHIFLMMIFLLLLLCNNLK